MGVGFYGIVLTINLRSTLIAFAKLAATLRVLRRIERD